ncbi:hypothetical protein [Scopulibacillus cellulosilyticus]|uniref:Prolyl 4-hydroxylase alpha subunit Fe(2+) 2OG dioxygenase domain-containing protein n=1 Tax=Scopulibacillus cellulosilyticus TaxID=2665665 RepID=A0ABW2PZG1_9BACL
MEKTMWSEVIYNSGDTPLGHQHIFDLVNNKCSGIVLRGVLDSQSLSQCQDAIDEYRNRAETSEYTNGSLTTIGPYLARNIETPDVYFDRANTTDELFPKKEFDLRAQVRETLQKVFDFDSIRVANDNGYSYAPCVVRLHGDGVSNPLHNDMIARDCNHTTLSLKKLVAQLSCVVCIQECDFGGELMHYRKVWKPEDEQYKIPRGLGYNHKVVEDVECWKFKPETGDVYLINPTNYHSIEKVGGTERRTLGFFIGFYEDNLKNPVVWG